MSTLPGRMIAAACAVLLTLGTCAGCDASSGSASPNQPVIGFLTYSRSFEFYRNVEQGINRAAAGRAKVIVKDPYGDLSQQINDAEDLIAQGANVIAMVPVDSRGAIAEGQMVRDAKIPLVTVDLNIATDVGQQAFIGSDHRQGGRMVAQKLIGLLGGKGDVAILDNPALASTTEREQGFREGLAAAPGMHVVAAQSGNSDREQAQAIAEGYLQHDPNLRAIYAVNDEMALGALQAVNAAGRQGQVVVTGFDASNEALQAIEAGGAFRATVAQDPGRIGQLVVDTALDILAGKKPPKTIAVPVTLVDAANVRQFLK